MEHGDILSDGTVSASYIASSPVVMRAGKPCCIHAIPTSTTVTTPLTVVTGTVAALVSGDLTLTAKVRGEYVSFAAVVGGFGGAEVSTRSGAGTLASPYLVSVAIQAVGEYATKTCLGGTFAASAITLPAKAAANAVAADYVSITDVNGDLWAVGLKRIAADVKDKNRVTFATKVGTTDGDFITLTDAAGLKWAIAIDIDGTGVANAGTIWNACAGRQIVVDCSDAGITTAAHIGTAVHTALTAPFLAVFTATDNTGTVDFEAKTAGACAAAETLAILEGAGSASISHTATGILATTEPTGSNWVTATAARRAMCDISAATTGGDVATAVRVTLAGLTDIGNVITVGAAVGDGIPLTHKVIRKPVAVPVPKNADDTGAGSITAASVTTGVVSAVNVTDNSLTIATHGLVTGVRVILTSSGALPTGAPAGNAYVIRVDASTIKLSDTYAHAVAGTNIYDITTQGDEAATITVTSVPSTSIEVDAAIAADTDSDATLTCANGGGANQAAVAVTPLVGNIASAFNVTDDTITKAAHGLVNGQNVAVTIGGGSLPTGLTTPMYAIVVDSSTIKLATSQALALAGTAVDITDQGTTTQTVTLTPAAFAGAIKLQRTCGPESDESRWIDIPSSSQTAAAAYAWNLEMEGSRAVRVVMTLTGGDGTLFVMAYQPN